MNDLRPSTASRHARADSSPHWNVGRVKVLQAEDIDPEVVRRDTLAVERIDATGSAEVVRGRIGVELIGTQRLFAGEKTELTLMDLDHQGILAATDGAIASRQLGEVRGDLEPDRAAVTTARVSLVRPSRHGCAVGANA